MYAAAFPSQWTLQQSIGTKANRPCLCNYIHQSRIKFSNTTCLLFNSWVSTHISTRVHTYHEELGLYARVSDWKGHNRFDRSQHVRHSAYILHACIRAYTNMCHNAGKYIRPYLVKCSTTFLTLRNAKMCPFTAEVLLQQQQRADSTLSKYHTSFTEHTGQV